jgi:hypothetical protein
MDFPPGYVRQAERGGKVRIGCSVSTTERIGEMRRRYGTYTAYSIACAIVWAVILAVVSTAGDAASRHTFLLVCGGWAIGWLSATIARGVYPPPKRHIRQ